jgi:hypothetical protein
MRRMSTVVLLCLGAAAWSAGALADDTKMGDLSSPRGLSALAAGGNSDARPQLAVGPRPGIAAELTSSQMSATGTQLKVGETARTDSSLKLGSKLPPGGADARLSSFAAGGSDSNAFSNATSSATLSSISPPAPAAIGGIATSSDTSGQLRSYKPDAASPALRKR